MTAVEWYYEQTVVQAKTNYAELLEQAKQIEREQLSKAMHHALDEDGHTGDWRIKFINDYYESNFGVRP